MTVLATSASPILEPPSLWDVAQEVANSVFGAGSVTAWFIGVLICLWLWVKCLRDGYRTARRTGKTVMSAIPTSS